MSELNWISAFEAISALGESVGPVQSRQARSLCQRAHWGLVRARAALYGSERSTQKDVEIPREFWWANGSEALHQDWRVGDFSSVVNGWAHNAFGVEFCREDIEKMGGIFPERQLEQRNRGGRRRSDTWPEFVAELCAYVHVVGIPDGDGTAGAEKVIADVTDLLMKRGIEDTVGRSTAQTVINAVLLRLRKELSEPTFGAMRRNPAD